MRPHLARVLAHQLLELFLVVDVAGDGGCDLFAAFLVDVGGDLLAGIGLAAGDNDLGAVLGEAMDDGLADALGRAGDERDLAAQIEQNSWISPRMK